MLNHAYTNPEYKKKYLQTIITAYASQNPQNLSAALKLISELENSEEKDSCVTYLCFLQDVNVVYKSALSLYDVSLALLVAQKSQMDPREYLPFLQELQDNEPLRRKFLIDDYLGNYDKALEHLSEIDKDGNVSEEVIDYVESHDLYKHGLALYRYDSEKQNVIYNIYAKHLSSNQKLTA